MRTLVIGDIHGGLRALKQVLERSGFNNQKDKAIFLGDYVDGWSESAEVVEFLVELDKYSLGQHVFLRGNHDKWAEDWLAMGIISMAWEENGGYATKRSYINTGFLSSDAHREFFRKLHNYYVDEQNRGFVHGGFVSKNGLGNEAYQTNYFWDRTLFDLALLQHNRPAPLNYSSEALAHSRKFEKHKEIYIGHTSTGNWNCKRHYPEYHIPEQKAKNGIITVPMNRCNIWNLDTGGGFEGKLTIMDIDTKQFWQSDYVRELYPEEKGRN